MVDAKCRVVFVEVEGSPETIRETIERIARPLMVAGDYSSLSSTTFSGVSDVKFSGFDVAPTAPAIKPKVKKTVATPVDAYNGTAPTNQAESEPIEPPVFAENGSIKTRLAKYLLGQPEHTAKIGEVAKAIECSANSLHHLLARNDACFRRPGFGLIELTEAGKRFAKE